MPGISKEQSARRGKKKKKGKKPARKATGEAELFKTIWDSAAHQARRSFVTGFPLPDVFDMRTFYFSHVLSKAKNKYPMFMLYDYNIVFMTLEEHALWEHHKYKIKDLPEWEHVFNRESELKELYHEHKQRVEQGRAEFFKR